MEKAKPSYRRSRLQQELWTVCVSTEGGILEGEGRICDTGKALDFPPLWFGTRRSLVSDTACPWRRSTRQVVHIGHLLPKRPNPPRSA